MANQNDSYGLEDGWRWRDQRNNDTDDAPGFGLTQHARERMCRRRISLHDICAALDYGRAYYARGAVIYALDGKGVQQCRNDGDQTARLDGLQVVCSLDGRILTAYRNKDFRGLKPRSGRRRNAHRRNSLTAPRRRDTFRGQVAR